MSLLGLFSEVTKPGWRSGAVASVQMKKCSKKDLPGGWLWFACRRNGGERLIGIYFEMKSALHDRSSMKRYLFCLPLLGLAPLSYFLSFYLDGRGMLPRLVGIIIGFGSMFVVPLIVSCVFAVVPKVNWVVRLALAICTLVVQFIILFTVDKPGATYEMIGKAHRLQNGFAPEQLHQCAGQLLKSFHAGTLAVRNWNRDKDDDYPGFDASVVVANAELPISIRGRFKRIFIKRNPNTDDEQVVFVLNRETGIICDGRKNVRDFTEYSMVDGVEAYWLRR